MAQGWECPKCGGVYAPWMAECTRCNAVTTVSGGVVHVYPGTGTPFTRPSITAGG